MTLAMSSCKEQVLDALRTVQDPDLKQDLVTLGMIALEILLYVVCIKLFPVLHAPVRQVAHA